LQVPREKRKGKMKKARILTVLVVGAMMQSMLWPSVFAIPSHTDHPHKQSCTRWTENGSPPLPWTKAQADVWAHNHHSHWDFGNIRGPGRAVGYDAYSVWDDRDYRFNAANDPGAGIGPLFLQGHGYIDETDAASIPHYLFTNKTQAGENSPMPDEAIHRVDEAFAKWDAIPSDEADHLIMGLAFERGGNDIKIYWESIPNITLIATPPSLWSSERPHDRGIFAPPTPAGDAMVLGEWVPEDKHLKFNKDVNWYYDVDPKNIQANQYHFFTIALHEIGHIVGLEDQYNGGNQVEVMWGFLGPGADAHVHTVLTAGAILGARDLYSIPSASNITVGGFSFSISQTAERPEMLCTYVGLASTILVTTVATALYVKRVNRRKEKQ
jgi:hypothetical protein